MLRTHNCNELSISDLHKKIFLNGWARSIRNHGNLTFIDLCDFYGTTQIVFDINYLKKNYNLNIEKISLITKESVLSIEGVVKKRPSNTENKNIITGQIEVFVESFLILNNSKILPFEVDSKSLYSHITEELRLKYRYLDFRRTGSKKILIFRSKLIFLIRQFLHSQNFLEIETPILAKSTPEGSRDYVVPSRIYPHSFYALPQSPQIFKQLLMIGGIDKYFQIAKCFRDEDSRLDRQPEFTQLDLEMSFVDVIQIKTLIEKLFSFLWEKLYNKKLNVPFQSFSFNDLISKYGSDKPDLRFDLPMVNVSHIFKNSSFNIFNNELKTKEGIINCINLKHSCTDIKITNSILKNFSNFLKNNSFNNFFYIKITDTSFESSITKFLSPESLLDLKKIMDAEPNDILILFAGKNNYVQQACSLLRNKISSDLNIKKNSDFLFSWVTDFPLFKKDSSNNIVSNHHPFVKPSSPLSLPYEQIKSTSFDLLLNGFELGSGSLRINDPSLQTSIFTILGLSKEQIEKNFGFLLESQSYGAPIHGGIGIGLDRLLLILLKKESIRDVIPFPKNKKAKCLLQESPSPIDLVQLKELNISLDKQKL